jgi:hypothetical protein
VEEPIPRVGPLWLEHLGIIATWGRGECRQPDPPPTDDELRAASRAYPNANTIDFPSDLDQPAVTELGRLLAGWLDQHWPGYHTPPHLSTAIANTDSNGRDTP